MAASTIPNSVLYEEEYVLNSRGLKLFTCRWLPASKKIKALVLLCHGYGVECSVFMRATGIRLAQAGYAVFGIDYEGHGKSEGMRCYISDLTHVAGDCVDFFRTIREKEEYRDKARFLLGESMGGTVALLIHRQEPSDWNGAVLVAPMCKISEELKPPPVVVSILSKLANFIPTWKIVPSRDIIETGFRDPLKRQELRSNPYSYQDKPRLRTGLELMRASMDMEGRLDEVTLPFLVLHGEADVVTEPRVSVELYEVARSFDKTLRTYPGMWHSLIYGEWETNIDTVFADIVRWLDERSPRPSGHLSPDLQPHSSIILNPASPNCTSSAAYDIEGLVRLEHQQPAAAAGRNIDSTAPITKSKDLKSKDHMIIRSPLAQKLGTPTPDQQYSVRRV